MRRGMTEATVKKAIRGRNALFDVTVLQTRPGLWPPYTPITSEVQVKDIPASYVRDVLLPKRKEQPILKIVKCKLSRAALAGLVHAVGGRLD